MRVVRWVGCVLVANIIGIYTVYPVVMVGLTFGSVFGLSFGSVGLLPGLSSSVGVVGSVGSVGSTHVGQLTRFGSGDTRLLNPSVMGCSRFGSGGQFPCAIASPTNPNVTDVTNTNVANLCFISHPHLI